ncbi:MAG: MFS transporter [Acidimicrobiia bacterium]
MSEDPPAPFVPAHTKDEPPLSNFLRIFGTREYFRLWLAQVASSTGDWLGLFAVLAIATRISDNSGAAVSLVMVARVVPGFFLATVGGVIIDRLDRRKVMVFCDIGRASLLAALPFVENLLGLVLISFGLEILTLLWGPAKDASVPNLVDREHLTSVNTVTLVASFGTFPFASIIFVLLASLAGWLADFDALSGLRLDQEVLALIFDAFTFLVSAAIVWRLPIPHEREKRERRPDWMQTVRDIREGLAYIATHPRVRGVIIGLGTGLIGAGAMIPLGPVFARQGLGGDSATFGVLQTALGFGAAVGVVSLLAFQRRVKRELVFELSVMATGVFLVVGATFSWLFLSALAIALVGACAGMSYVTGFTTLQESVEDELRGRTFATLYTVIRLCLLLTLVVSPLWADFWEWFVGLFADSHTISIGGASYALPGVRVALWVGGLMTIAAGLWARHSVLRAERADRQASESDDGPEPAPDAETS